MIGFNKRNAEQAADRLHRFFSRQMTDEICAQIDIRYLENPEETAPDESQVGDGIATERDPLGLNELPLVLEMYRRIVRRNYENPDDSLFNQIVGFYGLLPALHLESAIETAILGGKVKYVGTRLHTYGDPVEPLIKDYRDFDWQLPREDNPWFQCYLEAHRFFAQHAEHDFPLVFSACQVGMNMAVQLRGTERAYLDMYEEPDNLQRLLDYSCDLSLYLYGRVESIVGLHNLGLYGDHPLSRYRVDHSPGISVDAYSLCKPGVLRDWGMNQIKRFIERVGGAVLHIHENGRQVIEEVTEIPGFRSAIFSDAPGWPRSFDIRWELRKRLNDIPMAVFCEKDEFLAALKLSDLPGNTQYYFSVDTLDEAKWIMEQVHTYRAPSHSK